MPPPPTPLIAGYPARPEASAASGGERDAGGDSVQESVPCASAVLARAAEAACLAAEGDASEPVRLVHFSLWSRAPASGPPLSFRARVLSSDGPWVTVEVVGFDEAGEAVATGTALFDRPARYPGGVCP